MKKLPRFRVNLFLSWKGSRSCGRVRKSCLDVIRNVRSVVRQRSSILRAIWRRVGSSFGWRKEKLCAAPKFVLRWLRWLTMVA